MWLGSEHLEFSSMEGKYVDGRFAASDKRIGGLEHWEEETEHKQTWTEARCTFVGSVSGKVLDCSLHWETNHRAGKKSARRYSRNQEGALCLKCRRPEDFKDE